MPTTPTSANVISYLSEQCGVTISTSTSLDRMVSEIIEEIPIITGWNPVIASNTNSSRFYDLPLVGSPLRLDGGLLSVASVKVNGSALTLNSQYTLEPPNASAMGKPYTAIRFLHHFYGPARCVEVNGIWGRFSDWPADIFEAVVLITAGRVLEQIRQGKISESGVSWSLGDVKESYGGDKLGGEEGEGAGGSLINRGMAMIKRRARADIWG